MARLRNVNGNYYARFYSKGRSPQRKTVSLETRDEAAARAKLKRLEVHYAEGSFDPWASPEPQQEPDPVAFSEAVAAFYGAKAHLSRSLRLYRLVLDGLLEAAGDKPVERVAPTDVRAFLASRDLNDSGRETYLVRMKAFFRATRLRLCRRAQVLSAGARSVRRSNSSTGSAPSPRSLRRRRS